MMKKTVYIETMGCQMNKLDSELIREKLMVHGCEFTDHSDQADIIIFNTCSVRQHAEDKVISKIGQLKHQFQKHPDLILAIVGCMAQRMGQQLLDDYPQVAIVCSPSRIHQLPSAIEQASLHQVRSILLNDSAKVDDLEQFDLSRSKAPSHLPFMAYVRAMRGCNNYCSYCIVPYVRGHERSRPIGHIIEESKRLVDNGVIEITLVGQTINSYEYTTNEHSFDLADVLEQVHEIPGLKRLRFVTNYPRNFNERILHAMADLPKVCEYLHIPAQSGSDRILKAMNRHYTAQHYLDIIDRARDIVPNITFSGDFIVGFCGEQEEDFQATKTLVEKVRYKNCFIFKYSPRPGTRADEKLADDVPEEIKRRRNTELLDLQNLISEQDNQRFIGQTVDILVEGPSKKPHLNRTNNSSNDETTQLVGRTQGDHIVVFDGTEYLIGHIIKVIVTKASALTLFAQTVQ